MSQLRLDFRPPFDPATGCEGDGCRTELTCKGSKRCVNGRPPPVQVGLRCGRCDERYPPGKRKRCTLCRGKLHPVYREDPTPAELEARARGLVKGR